MSRSIKLFLVLGMVLSLVLSACGQATPVPTAAPVTEAPVVVPPGATVTISGLVNQELTLNTADTGGLEVVKLTAEHPKNGPGEYEGVRLSAVLEKAGVKDGAGALLITASDGFSAEAALADVQACADCLLGIADGKFNMVMPGFSSKTWVKDVVTIELIEATVEVPPAPANPTLILATTTSLQDSGLLDALIPLFEAQTGYKVQTVAVGSGAAIQMGREGNADVLFVHSPTDEKTLMTDGFGKERVLIAHNDYIIVGPEADPAAIKGLSPVDAFKAIYAAGSPFVARADKSGTSTKELGFWKKAEHDPATEKPAWYIETGQGMGASLTIASEKGAYILTDRGTFLANKANLQLTLLVENDPSLLNVYHVITVNPDKWPKVNYEGALAFLNFMLSPTAQDFMATFGVDKFGIPLFNPDGGKTDADLGL
jgi:tungstate transport system substrate-binding protein